MPDGIFDGIEWARNQAILSNEEACRGVIRFRPLPETLYPQGLAGFLCPPNSIVFRENGRILTVFLTAWDRVGRNRYQQNSLPASGFGR
jgi:hypothetical protein